jgi:hypothetical protein
MNFPARSRQIRCSVQQNSLFGWREFGSSRPDLLRQPAINRATGTPDFAKFPVNFPVLREFGQAGLLSTLAACG